MDLNILTRRRLPALRCTVRPQGGENDVSSMGKWGKDAGTGTL